MKKEYKKISGWDARPENHRISPRYSLGWGVSVVNEPSFLSKSSLRLICTRERSFLKGGRA